MPAPRQTDGRRTVSSVPSLALDGFKTASKSDADNLVVADTNDSTDVFLRRPAHYSET